MSISKSTNSALSDAGSILGALDATANWRALLLTASSVAVFLLIFGAGAMLAARTFSPLLAGISSLIAIGLLILGLSASGFIMMDAAHETPPRDIFEALISSVISAHRLILALLVLVAAYLVWLILLGLLLLLCKLPGLGPMLYTLVFPLSVLVTGIFTIFMTYAGMGVIAPSVWDGGNVMDTIARLWAIARERFMSLLVLSILLGLLSGVVGALVFGVLLSGLLLVGGFSTAILGVHLAPGIMIMSGMGAMEMMNNAGSYMTAAMLGGGVLFCLAAAIPINVSLLGTCINYLKLTESLDISRAQQEIQAKLEEARKRAEAARARAQAKIAATSPIPAVEAGSTSIGVCPSCNSQVAADDIFCGNCGTKLR